MTMDLNKRNVLLEVLQAENDTKQHLTDAEYDGNLHFERVEESYFVLCQLPSLQITTHVTSLIHLPPPSLFPYRYWMSAIQQQYSSTLEICSWVIATCEMARHELPDVNMTLPASHARSSDLKTDRTQ